MAGALVLLFQHSVITRTWLNTRCWAHGGRERRGGRYAVRGLVESLVLPEVRKDLQVEGTLGPKGLRVLRAEVAESASLWKGETGSLRGAG